MACRVLEFLLSHGLKLRHGSEDRIAQSGTGAQQAMKVAAAEGEIPEATVVGQFMIPGKLFPCINLLQI